VGWIIVNKDNTDLAWNDSSKSWEGDDFDTFSFEEKKTMTLPDRGEWIQVPWSKQ
jgi:hypothetical protein